MSVETKTTYRQRLFAARAAIAARHAEELTTQCIALAHGDDATAADCAWRRSLLVRKHVQLTARIQVTA